MGPANYIMAWQESAAFDIIIQDRYLDSGFSLPKLDEQQDIANGQGIQKNNDFLVMFDFPLDTNDPNDLNLTEHGDSVSLQYAWGAAPVDEPEYHGSNRGRINVNLFAPSVCELSPCPGDDCGSHGD